MAFLSLSIDLAGSTLAKQRIAEISTGDDKLARRLYDDYARILYRLERDFYLDLVERGEINLRDLYLIKTLGDEYWYAVDIDAGDRERVARTVVALIRSLMGLIAGERYLSLPRPHPGNGGNGGNGSKHDSAAGSGRDFNFPIKVLLDLVVDTVELNQDRYQYLKDVVQRFIGKGNTVYAIDEAFVAVSNRLNLGSRSAADGARRMQTRRDYIGPEIDRFFRLAKLCRPAILSVGETLFDFLDVEVSPVLLNGHSLAVRIARFPDLGDDAAPVVKYVIPETIPARAMKGVTTDYRLFHLFGRDCLGEQIFAPSEDIEPLMGETRGFLAECGFYALDAGALLP